MKNITIILAAIGFMACSSPTKQSDATIPQATPPTPVVQKNNPPSSDIVKKESCESDQDQRSLEVHKKDPGCELLYTKFGKGKVVASSKHGTKHCEDSLEKLVKKLESQKFTCHES
jgi:hypothetical protein